MISAEEQPLPPIDSPTTDSPGYVTESDPEEDPEEYEDDETEDGPVDYPMDGGDDGDDDDGDSSRDDANDEDEDKEDEDTGERGALMLRLIYRHKLLMILESRLARIASTQTLIDAVTAALPSPSLPPLPPSLYIPPPAPDMRLERVLLLDLPEVDPAEAVPEIACMTMGEVNTRVTELAELHERDTQDLYSPRTVWIWMEEPMLPARLGSFDRIDQATHQASTHRDHVGETNTLSITPTQTTETDRRRQDQMVEALRVIRDMRREMSDMQAELLALREPQRRAGQSGPEARIPDHQEASGDADSHI
ncbi:hypothetical protein Tco_0037909 [Tanacetum coccineum]